MQTEEHSHSHRCRVHCCFVRVRNFWMSWTTWTKKNVNALDAWGLKFDFYWPDHRTTNNFRFIFVRCSNGISSVSFSMGVCSLGVFIPYSYVLREVEQMHTKSIYSTISIIFVVPECATRSLFASEKKIEEAYVEYASNTIATSTSTSIKWNMLHGQWADVEVVVVIIPRTKTQHNARQLLPANSNHTYSEIVRDSLLLLLPSLQPFNTIAGTLAEQLTWMMFILLLLLLLLRCIVVVVVLFFSPSSLPNEVQREQVLPFGYCSTHCSRFINCKCTDVRRGLCVFILLLLLLLEINTKR